MITKYRILKQRFEQLYKIQIKRLFWWIDYKASNYPDFMSLTTISEKRCHELMKDLYGKQCKCYPEWIVI